MNSIIDVDGIISNYWLNLYRFAWQINITVVLIFITMLTFFRQFKSYEEWAFRAPATL